MRILLERHAEVSRKLTEPLDPHRGYRKEMWGVRHERKGSGVPLYHAQIYLPPDFDRDEVGLFRNPLAKHPKTLELVKAVDADDSQGRWITVHPHGEDEKGIPVFIHPNPDGSHTIVRGAGGSLNGLRLTGVKSPEEYKQLAKQRRDERKEAMRQRDLAERQRLGADAYAQRAQEKQARAKEIVEAKRNAEREFVKQVFKAQGIDEKHLDLPKDAVSGVADEKIAQRLADKHHAKLVAYAKAVAGSVKEIVRDGLDQLASDSAGELGVSDLVDAAFGGGNGYHSPAKALAADLGLDPAAQKELVAGFRFRDLLERSDMNVAQAAEKREQIQGRTEARRTAESKLKSAAQALGEEGVGPEAVKQFSEIPKVETMSDAVEILKAARMADQAGQAAQSLKHELEMVDDLDKLPRAAVVVAKPMSDAEAKDAIAATLGEEAMQHAMTRLVKTSNDLEREYGTLRRHYSVGAALAFNTICHAVDGQSVDPMLHDILGTSGAAAAIVAGWRQSLGPEEFGKLKDVLAKQHVKTQEDLANTATDEANEYLDQHEEMVKSAVDPDSPEGLAAAIQQHAERTELLARARESVGIARGRLEAAAALNEAMMHAKDEPVQVSLGNMPLGDALANCYALGLTDPVKYNKSTGEIDKAGDYELSRQGENTFLTIHPSGLSKLTSPPDPELLERADRSAAIKAGKFDEPDWLPRGISDRPRTSYSADALQRNSIDHRLEVTGEMSGPRIADAVKQHIGALLNDGRDADDIAARLRSEEFVGGLNLTPDAEARYLKAVNEVAPAFSSTPGLSESERVEEFKQFQEKRRASFSQYLAQHLASEAKAGRLNPIAAGLDKQTVPTDARTHDALYVAALADPRTRFAFHSFGDLGDDGRAAVRSYANEHLFGVDPKTDGDQIITPLTDQQRKAFEQWREFDQGKGDPYSVIQEHWRKSDEDNAGLFGDPEIHPLASVNLTNDAAVVEAARKAPQMLGYKPMRTGEGKDIYPELEVGSRWVSDDGATWRQSDVSDRTEQSVAQDARVKVKTALRQHWLKNMLGMSDLAETGWSPTSVKTAGDRWAEYASNMGEEAAYRTVQEFMAGDIVQRFAAEHAARGGTPFQLASRPVDKSEQHAVAMLPPSARERLNSMDQAERATLMKRVRGRWVKTGSLKDKAAIAKVMDREASALFAVGKDEVNVKVHRATIGRSAEKALAGMLPSMDTARKMQAASGIKMSGQFINQQRAIKLILENKREGIALGVGSGKSIVATGAFTEARARGEAERGIFTVPSNIVEQFSDEIYKYHDPSTGLRWAHTSGKSAAERLKMLKDAGTHIVITTPEAMREDITQVVADHLGVSKSEARDRIMAESNEQKRHKLIHDAMDAAGIKFDFCAQDESHRMLDRAGKPDAHMAHIGDAVASKAKYFADLTADPVKSDASELHSKLNRIDPKRYPAKSRDAFLRRYGRQTIASGLAMQQELQPYVFADKIDLNIDNDHTVTSLDLTPEQKGAHDDILGAYRRARAAKRRGDVDIDALKQLSPNSFKNGDEDVVAKNLNRGLATLRDMALARVVNSHPGGAKENAVSDYASKHKGEGIVVFAHNLDSVKNIAKRLKAEGHRVGVLTGEMSGKAKNAMRLAFNPDQGEPSVDVLISSDAGAQGVNLQRGGHLLNVDVPLTSMIHQQRIGRILRPGQKASTVHVRDLVTNTDHDMRARRRLENKAQLRELTTSPSSAIDDSGLGAAIEQAQIRKVLTQAKKKAA